MNSSQNGSIRKRRLSGDGSDGDCEIAQHEKGLSNNECSSELDVNTSSSKKKHVNSNALKTKQWRENQKLLHEKRKEDLDKALEENVRLRRENEELWHKMALLEEKRTVKMSTAPAALPMCVPGLANMGHLASKQRLNIGDLLGAGRHQIKPNVTALIRGGSMFTDSASDAEIHSRLIMMPRGHQQISNIPFVLGSSNPQTEIDLMLNRAYLQNKHQRQLPSGSMFPNGLNIQCPKDPLTIYANFLSTGVNYHISVSAQDGNGIINQQADASLKSPIQKDQQTRFSSDTANCASGRTNTLLASINQPKNHQYGWSEFTSRAGLNAEKIAPSKSEATVCSESSFQKHPMYNEKKSNSEAGNDKNFIDA